MKAPAPAPTADQAPTKSDLWEYLRLRSYVLATAIPKQPRHRLIVRFRAFANASGQGRQAVSDLFAWMRPLRRACPSQPESLMKSSSPAMPSTSDVKSEGGNYAKGLTRLAFEIEERSQEPVPFLFFKMPRRDSTARSGMHILEVAAQGAPHAVVSSLSDYTCGYTGGLWQVSSLVSHVSMRRKESLDAITGEAAGGPGMPRVCILRSARVCRSFPRGSRFHPLFASRCRQRTSRQLRKLPPCRSATIALIIPYTSPVFLRVFHLGAPGPKPHPRHGDGQDPPVGARAAPGLRVADDA